MGLLFCLPPLPLMQYNCGAVRATVSEGVSGYRFFICSLILDSSSTYLRVDETKFLIQHRREVAINAPPLPLRQCGHGPRRVTGYFRRKGTLSFCLFIAPLHWIFHQPASLLTTRKVLYSTGLRVAIDVPPSLRRCGRGVARANNRAMGERWLYFTYSSILVCTSTYLPVPKRL